MGQVGFPMRGYWITLAVLISITAVPMFVVTATNWFMAASGCHSDFKSGSVCAIGGADWGPTLNGVIAWSMITAAIAMWITLVGVAIWLVSLIVSFAGWQKAQRLNTAGDE